MATFSRCGACETRCSCRHALKSCRKSDYNPVAYQAQLDKKGMLESSGAGVLALTAVRTGALQCSDGYIARQVLQLHAEGACHMCTLYFLASTCATVAAATDSDVAAQILLWCGAGCKEVWEFLSAWSELYGLSSEGGFLRSVSAKIQGANTSMRRSLLALHPTCWLATCCVFYRFG